VRPLGPFALVREIGLTTTGAGLYWYVQTAWIRLAVVREVYLHVGPVKTGSTFLQDLLWRHRTTSHARAITTLAPTPTRCGSPPTTFRTGPSSTTKCRRPRRVAQVCQRALAYDGPSVISHEMLACRRGTH